MCFRVSGSILNPGAKNLIKHLNDILMISRLEKSSPDMKRYRLTDLPQAAQDALLKTRVLKNASEYRKQFAKNTEVESLFAGFGGDADETVTVDPVVEETRIIWATDSYEDREINPQDIIELDQVLHIIPRSEKPRKSRKSARKPRLRFSPRHGFAVCKVTLLMIAFFTIMLSSFSIMKQKHGHLIPKRWISRNPTRTRVKQLTMRIITLGCITLLRSDLKSLVVKHRTLSHVTIQ